MPLVILFFITFAGWTMAIWSNLKHIKKMVPGWRSDYVFFFLNQVGAFGTNTDQPPSSGPIGMLV